MNTTDNADQCDSLPLSTVSRRDGHASHTENYRALTVSTFPLKSSLIPCVRIGRSASRARKQTAQRCFLCSRTPLVAQCGRLRRIWPSQYYLTGTLLFSVPFLPRLTPPHPCSTVRSCRYHTNRSVPQHFALVPLSPNCLSSLCSDSC